MGRRTHLGIKWDSDFRFGPPKMLVGDKLKRYMEKMGGITGWYTKSNENRLVQLVGDRMPQVIKELREIDAEVNSANGVGSLLSHRAGYCLPPDYMGVKYGKDELQRFMQPSFASTYNAVVKSDEKLYYNRLQELQEVQTLLEYTEEGGGPGIYVRSNEEHPEEVYVGKSVAPPSRKHGSASHFVRRIYATNTIAVAGDIEGHIHDFLASVGEPIRAKSRGLFILRGQNALQVTLDHIDNHYRRLFHNRCTMKEPKE